MEIIDQSDDLEPRSVEECRQRIDWPKWKDAIQVELNSLSKREVFGPIIQIPKGIKPVEYRWFLCENGMKKMKLLDTKHDLLHKVFPKNLTLIMKRLTLLWWMQSL